MTKLEEEYLEKEGWTICCESPLELEHSDGSTVTGNAAKYVIDGLLKDYKIEQKRIEEEKLVNQKKERVSNLKLDEINGFEIINFLNTLSLNLTIYEKSFVFEKQEHTQDKYTLYFKCSYDNWGTIQDYSNNGIEITENGIIVYLDEIFDGNCDEEELEEVIGKWIKKHTFKSLNILITDFDNDLSKVQNSIPDINFSDIEKIDEIITELVRIKTYMKKI